ncbi:PQQ-binding-like beta-propeller repeat protein [Actinophytocola sp.]|uniref:outer membrane protein assembly factor BamB family protein n=1 Tax=Actinophytocola sp. TaxID=1872138 RepID=UPI002D7F23EE|nr:PQQ-binding-like beta-propeller repeat protein [Actinophytocola sp.]HET9139054.1 PQQ-binding-like beta-propeller repeat protein [Actinophytocola sp.]
MARIQRRDLIKGAAATAVGASVLPAALAAPAAAAPPRCDLPGGRDFPKVGGNLGNQNYSALGGMHRGNVRRLGAAWVNRIEGGLSTGTNQSTAVAVGGVLYIESAPGNVFAVDGATGVTKWVYRQTRGTLTRRGVGVGGGKVFTHGRGNWIIALDQETGAVVWEKQITGFGNMEKVAVTYHDGRLYCGTHDGDRGAGLALDAGTGDVVWHFWGAPEPGEIGNDTWEGESWRTGGATPWLHPAIDPELGLVYWAFGNARGSRSSQDGSQRAGLNLFSSSLVAMDLETGQYRWHFQSIHHGIWDMDNTMAPVLADVRIRGRMRKLVVYGSKCGMYYILDRRDGSAPLGIDERPVPQDERQKTWPTQPFPRQGPWTETRVVDQPLGTAIPGDPNRAVPNYVQGALYDPHWDVPVLSIPGHGGGADWSHQSFSHSTRLVYTGFGYVAAAHSLTEASNGLRPPGEYQTGGIVAVDPSTNRVRWKKHMPYSLAHGNGILTTAGDLLFIGQPDGNLLALDARNGHELWRFQTGAAISSSPIMYEVDGQQYLAVYAGGTGIPYGDSAPRGDFLWAFKLGGSVAPAPTPPPPVVRRPVSGPPVDGTAVNNTVVIGRTYNPATGAIGATESTAVNAMAPTHLRVPAGTTVTFTNHPDNAGPRGATQFFEGLFNIRLIPGESYRHTFPNPGEYFFNDPASPRSTGKIEVY